jgi:hypothetical protein
VPPVLHLMPAFGLEPGPGWIVVTALVSTVWSLQILGIRVYTRLRINGPFGPDDTMCAVSTGFGVLYSIIALVAVGYGWGSSNKHGSNVVAMLIWTNGFIISLCTGFSKLSACYLIARITKTRKHLVIAYSLITAIVLWMLVSSWMNAFACHLPRPWIGPPVNTCPVNRVSTSLALVELT